MSGKRTTRIEGHSTKVYMENVMKKVFRREGPDQLTRLLSGDGGVLEECATYLSLNLDYRQLLHTLCLVTGTRFDLEYPDPAKAADAWICWYGENKERLVWDRDFERWAVPK